MATHVAFLPPAIRLLIQENHLADMIKEPLVPQNLFRQGIEREKWNAKSGESLIITRNGTLAPVVAASTPRTDPTPQAPTLEQWGVTAENLQGAVEIDIRQNYHTITQEFRRQIGSLGLQAGTSVSRWVRSKLFQSYGGGHTWLTAGVLLGGATLTVQSISGFTHNFNTDGRLVPVSAATPISITVDGETVSVVAATPTNPALPHGAGTLTLAVGVVAGHLINVPVLAATRPRIIRVGGATTTRGIGAGNLITLTQINSGVAYLRTLGVPTFSDGRYRCHLSPEAVRQLREDAAWQLQVRGVPDHERVTGFEVGQLSGCTFIENAESPTYYNVAAGEDFNGAVTSAQTGGQNICRTIITGPGTVVEHYVPEDDFETTPSTAGFGKREMLGKWVDQGNYVKGLVEGIHIYFRLPLDAKGERSTVTWSWTGDYGVPTDFRAQVNSQAAYKRAVIVESCDLG